MLPKKARLTSEEVREVLKKGRTLRTGTVSVKYLSGGIAKAAVVVSAKVAKSAVERNRLRRAAYQGLLRPLPKNTYMVFFIHTKEFLKADIISLCSKLS